MSPDRPSTSNQPAPLPPTCIQCPQFPVSPNRPMIPQWSVPPFFLPKSESPGPSVFEYLALTPSCLFLINQATPGISPIFVLNIRWLIFLRIQVGIARSRAMFGRVSSALFYTSELGPGDYSQKNNFPRRNTVHPDPPETSQPAQPFSSSLADSRPAQAGRQATNQSASEPET